MRFTKILVIVLVVAFSGCAFYHLQTPETVPQGKIAGGVGLAGIPIGNAPFAIPGFWVRTGVSPNMDVGVHTWGLGMKVDAKYAFNDYIALGAGGLLAFPFVFVYGLEGSVYAGIPIGEVLYPYGVARLSFVNATETISGDYNWLGFSSASGVVGFRVRLGGVFSIYGEGGVGVPLGIGSSAGSTEVGDPGFIFGLGVSVGN